MLITCWSAKGGVGTTVVSVALATVLARTAGRGALLADLAGDIPAALGHVEPPGPGLAGWMAAGPAVPADALARLETDVGDGLSLLARGDGPLDHGDRADVLAELLAADPRPAIVDAGIIGADTAHHAPVALALAGASTHSLLVTRACYLGLRRAAALPIRPSGVVLVVEPGRALGRSDVERVLGAPVRAEIAIDPSVARAVDAGLLASRLPRPLERALRHAA